MSLKFCNFAVSHLVSQISLLNWQARSMSKVNKKKLNKEGFFLYWGIISHLSLYTVAISVWPLSVVPTALTNVKRLIDCMLIYSSTNESTKTFKTIGAILWLKKYGTIYQAQARGILVGHVHHVRWSIHQLPKCVVHATQTEMEWVSGRTPLLPLDQPLALLELCNVKGVYLWNPEGSVMKSKQKSSG